MTKYLNLINCKVKLNNNFIVSINLISINSILSLISIHSILSINFIHFKDVVKR